MRCRHGNRRYLFAACALGGVIAAIAVVGAEPSGPEGSANAPSGDPPSVTEDPGEQHAPQAGTEPPDAPETADARSRARPIARAFMYAFLRYERGSENGQVRRALARSAHANVVRELLSRPVRAGTRTGPGRLVRLSLYGPFGRTLKASAEVAYPRSGPALVELALKRRAREWRVAQVRP